MVQPTKNLKLTTCQVVVTRGLKRRLRSLITDNGLRTADPATVVIGRCEDCGSLIYADDLLTSAPEPAPAQVDEWEYYQ